MDETEVWAAVDRRRQEIADFLDGLAPGDWANPSLCEAWTVREVAAHLTLPALPPWRLFPLFLRYPGSTNRTIRDGSKAVARGMDEAQIVAAIRRMVGFHRHFPGLTCREALIDLVGHTMPDGACGHDPRTQGPDPVLKATVGGGHHHGALRVRGEQMPDDGHDLVVPLTGGVDHLDPGDRLEAAGAALGD